MAPIFGMTTTLSQDLVSKVPLPPSSEAVTPPPTPPPSADIPLLPGFSKWAGSSPASSFLPSKRSSDEGDQVEVMEKRARWEPSEELSEEAENGIEDAVIDLTGLDNEPPKVENGEQHLV